MRTDRYKQRLVYDDVGTHLQLLERPILVIVLAHCIVVELINYSLVTAQRYLAVAPLLTHLVRRNNGELAAELNQRLFTQQLACGHTEFAPHQVGSDRSILKSCAHLGMHQAPEDVEVGILDLFSHDCVVGLIVVPICVVVEEEPICP